jgi:phage gp37-like protein
VSTYWIDDIEDGIITTLDASEMATYIQFRDTLGSIEEMAGKALTQVPAYFVVFTDGVAQPLTGSGLEMAPGRFIVLVVSRNIRNRQAQRRGGPGPTEVGTYEMVKHVMAALHESNLGLEIEGCDVRQFSRIELGDKLKAYSVYGVAVDVTWRLI